MPSAGDPQAGDAVAVVRSFFEVLAARDEQRVLAHLDPEIEWRPAVGEVYHGHEGVGAAFEQFMDAWDDYVWEPEELIRVSDKTVVALTFDRGRGRGSGIEIERRFASVWSVRDGRIVRFEEFHDREDALAAANPQARRTRP